MRPPTKPFGLCVDNTGYEASLITGKVYPVLPDARPKDHFAFVDFPASARRRILELQTAT